MKQTVKYHDKEYILHSHAPQLVGNDLVPDYISSYLERGTFYEEPLLSYLHDRYGHLKTVIDCGANIGNHSYFFAHVMGAKVYAFEPHPENFRILEKNNPGHSINVALGAKKGKAGLKDYAHNMGMTMLIKGTDTEVRTVDSYGITPDLIKIDVEGMEDQVIQGALKTIKEHRPILVVEHNDIQALYRTARVLDGLDYFIKVFPVETWEVFLYLPGEQL